MEAKRVTMADIAKECGVSKASVSFAFNNPGKIKKETYLRIMDVAKKLDYIPIRWQKGSVRDRTTPLDSFFPST